MTPACLTLVLTCSSDIDLSRCSRTFKNAFHLEYHPKGAVHAVVQDLSGRFAVDDRRRSLDFGGKIHGIIPACSIARGLHMTDEECEEQIERAGDHREGEERCEQTLHDVERVCRYIFSKGKKKNDNIRPIRIFSWSASEQHRRRRREK